MHGQQVADLLQNKTIDLNKSASQSPRKVAAGLIRSTREAARRGRQEHRLIVDTFVRNIEVGFQ